MKAIFTSLMILMISFSFAQSPLYTLNDSKGNKYEVYSDHIKRIPTKVTKTMKSPGTTVPKELPEKSVEIPKATASELKRYFEAAIAATADQVLLKTNPSITYTVDSVEKTIYLKPNSTSYTTIQKRLETLLAN